MRYLNLYNSPSRWDSNLFGNFDRLFSDMLEPVASSSPYEVSETDGAYLLSVDAPGMKKDDIKIEVVGNTLTITGERRGRDGQERNYRKFTRSFTLPDSIDAAKIEANFEDGVLEIAIPKSETAKPRQIEVQASSGKGGGFFQKFLPKKDAVTKDTEQH